MTASRLHPTLRALLLDMRDRKGWKAKGYESFEAFGKSILGIEKTQLYSIAKAGEVQLSLPDSANSGKQIPETHLRPLAPLTDDERRQVWNEATAKAEADQKKQLVLCNTQSELHPLEEGKHAAESGLDLKAYAVEAGKKYTTLYDKVKAYRVMSVTDIGNEQSQAAWSQMVEIHAAPEWLWPSLVNQMLADGWTPPAQRTAPAIPCQFCH